MLACRSVIYTWYNACYEVPIVQSLTTHASTQPAVGAAKHHRQNTYLIAMFGHYIGGYFNNLIRLQYQTEFAAPLSINNNNTRSTLAGIRVSVMHALICPHTFEATNAGSRLLLPYIPLHDLKKGRGNSLKCNSANFSARRSLSGGNPGTWLLR